MKITINNETKTVLPLSQLSFSEFNRVMIQGEVTDLIGYLSLFFDLSREEILESRISSASIPALHASLFDVDITKAIKTKFDTVECLGETYLVSELDIDTFGKSYYFELRKQGKWNNYELSMYALALALSKGDDVDKVYEDLCGQPWVRVLPQAFFLLRRIQKKKLISKISLIAYTWELRKISFKIASYRRKYRGLEKRSSQRIYASDLM